jgi:hypothetical protein
VALNLLSPTAAAPPLEAIEAFAAILSQAYGSGDPRDYVEFDAVVLATFRWRLGEECGSREKPSVVLVDCVIQKAQQKGPEFFRFMVAAFFRALPWNVELRQWMTQHQPDDIGIVSPAEHESARSRRDQIVNVAQALDRIGEVRATAPVGEAIAEAHDDLADVMSRLRLLNACKNVHDLLHQIQVGPYQDVAALLLGREAFDPIQLTQLSANAQTVEDSGNRIESILQLITLPAGSDLQAPSDTGWLDDLRDAVAPLKVAPAVLASVRSGVYTLRILLRNQLPAYDAAILDAADGIPFTGLIAFLRSAAALDAVPNAVTTAAPDLAALDDQLKRLVQLHRAWQQIDVDLWQVDQEIWPKPETADAGVVAFLWKRLSRSLASVRALDANSWDSNLDPAMERVNAALEPGPVDAGALAALGAMIRMARLQFAKVDKMLLALCNQIIRLLGPIEALLQETAP